MTNTDERRFLRVRDVATELGVATDVVLSWIGSRKLIAADVSKGSGARPRWRIDRGDLDTFLAGRRTTLAAAPAARRSSRDVPRYV